MNELLKFGYENGETLECVELDGEPLFEPMSICKCLNLKIQSVTQYIYRMDDSERVDTHKLDESTLKNLKFFKDSPRFWVKESGLYALIFKSRKPEAQNFVKWVTNDVLPSIRKTGKYELQNRNKVTQELLQSMMENIKKITGVQPEELARVQNESYRAKLANLLNDVAKRDKVGTPFLYEKLYFLFAGETGFLIPELAKKAGISNSAYLKQHELSAKMLYEFALAYFYKDKRVVELIKLSPDQRTLAEF